MTYDIISITQEEVEALTLLQEKLLRTAQQKKDALYHTLQRDIRELKLMLHSANMYNSGLYAAMETELTEEYEYQVEILREQLVFSMSVREPTTNEELGGESGGGGQDSGGDETGYVVDYSLSYMERYIAVRDYYLTISDPNERMALYRQDEVAKRYLDSYYSYLYNYLLSFTV